MSGYDGNGPSDDSLKKSYGDGPNWIQLERILNDGNNGGPFECMSFNKLTENDQITTCACYFHDPIKTIEVFKNHIPTYRQSKLPFLRDFFIAFASFNAPNDPRFATASEMVNELLKDDASFNIIERQRW